MTSQKKRGNAEGSICKTARGWVVKITVRGPGGSRKRVQRSARSKPHARIVLEELRAEYCEPVINTEHVTVSEYLESWLKNVVKVQRSPATFDNYERTIRNHIKPTLGEFRLRQLSAITVDDWLATLAGRGGRFENPSKCLRDLHSGFESGGYLETDQGKPVRGC